jgi:Xaa-Pro aminopeptidase
LRLNGQQGLIRTYRWGADTYHGLVASGNSVDYPTPFDGPIGSPGLYPGALAGWSERRIRIGEPVLIDMLGGYGGYHADQTRVFSIGPLSDEFIEAHSFILELQSALEREFKPSVLPSDLYDMAIEMVKKNGYDDYFMNYGEKKVRFIGHGIGIELDEFPVIAGKVDDPLEEGNVFAFEPKIVFPGKGAVGIEDNYVITGNGYKRLTNFRREIVEL